METPDHDIAFVTLVARHLSKRSGDAAFGTSSGNLTRDDSARYSGQDARILPGRLYLVYEKDHKVVHACPVVQIGQKLA